MPRTLPALWKFLVCANSQSACLCVLLLASTELLAGAAKDPGDPSSAYSATTIASPSASSSSLLVVGTINVLNGNVFNLDDPQEDGLLYRLANRVHVTTRPAVIRQQLLFNTGDQVTIRELQESERILRSNRYIQEATIEPISNGNGTVDVNVRTTDGWTLVPRISLSRSGGKNNSGIGIKETNLLGTGVDIEALYKSNVDRDATILKFADRNLGSSWYQLNAVYANNSDGHTYQGDLTRPFYALDTTSAFGISFLDNEQIDSLYDRGEIMAQYENRASSFEVFKGWSNGLNQGWTRRYTAGLSYNEHRFSAVEQTSAPLTVLPDDRTLVYPFVGVELVQDKFEKTQNHDHVNRTEDRFLGTRIGARLGYASSSFGSDRDAWILNADAQIGFGDSAKRSLILASNLAGRVEDDGLQNVLVGISAKYYRRQSDHRLFFASLKGTYGHNLDLDKQILLGGDNGLRGYPLRYQTGDKNALLTLEQRFFTDWYPLRLFRVGGAIFFDAGRSWGRSPVSDRNNELLRDVGFGLRIGNARSGQGRTTHIDLAFPLDGDDRIKNVQFLVETRKSF